MNEEPLGIPDDELESVFRSFVPAESEEFVRPDQEVIDRFLGEGVDPGERATVELAMSLSESFRLEMLDLLRTKRAHSDPEAERRYRQALPSAAQLREILRRSPFQHGSPRHDTEQPAQRRGGLTDALRSLLWRPGPAYAIAAVAVLVVLLRVGPGVGPAPSGLPGTTPVLLTDLTRGSGARTVVAVSPGDALVGLSLRLPPRSPALPYRLDFVEIESGETRVSLLVDPPEVLDGNPRIDVSLPSSSLRVPGRYRVLATPVSPDGAVLEAFQVSAELSLQR